MSDLTLTDDNSAIYYKANIEHPGLEGMVLSLVLVAWIVGSDIISFWVCNWNCWNNLSNQKKSSGVMADGSWDDFIGCLLNDDGIFGKNIPFDTFSYINENNMYTMANKAGIMQDFDIKDEDCPNDASIFGEQPKNPSIKKKTF